MGVKGATEHAHFLKELHHARHIRSAIIECFERANEPNTPVALREALLRFVIVGGGPTGIEAAAEINDFITQDLRHLFPDIWFDAKIYVLEAGTKVLSQFDEDLREFCVRWFKRNRITIRTGCAVQEVTENSVILEDGSVIQCGFVLWSAGIQPRKVLLDPQ
jgi:NADH:ubiquinone reductase (non-electrogenic)